ncbi:MAG: hypothetical protein ABI425_03935 [Patescibacteria group bacterium]
MSLHINREGLSRTRVGQTDVLDPAKLAEVKPYLPDASKAILKLAINLRKQKRMRMQLS